MLDQYLLHQDRLVSDSGKNVNIFYLSLVDYLVTQRAMQNVVANKVKVTTEQSCKNSGNFNAYCDLPALWVLQHCSVFTQGTACQELLLYSSEIPVVKSDRGGQITYHGPGQLVVYPLINLREFKLGVKSWVNKLEQSVINTLKQFSINAERQPGAPGVYVGGKKIAALGLRIKNGVSYHGLSLNIDMDLQPFNLINPCGYAGLEVVQMRDFLPDVNLPEVEQVLVKQLLSLL